MNLHRCCSCGLKLETGDICQRCQDIDALAQDIFPSSLSNSKKNYSNLISVQEYREEWAPNVNCLRERLLQMSSTVGMRIFTNRAGIHYLSGETALLLSDSSVLNFNGPWHIQLSTNAWDGDIHHIHRGLKPSLEYSSFSRPFFMKAQFGHIYKGEVYLTGVDIWRLKADEWHYTFQFNGIDQLQLQSYLGQ